MLEMVFFVVALSFFSSWPKVNNVGQPSSLILLGTTVIHSRVDGILTEELKRITLL